jgi:hypothetical protein
MEKGLLPVLLLLLLLLVPAAACATSASSMDESEELTPRRRSSFMKRDSVLGGTTSVWPQQQDIVRALNFPSNSSKPWAVEESSRIGRTNRSTRTKLVMTVAAD